MAKKKRKLSAYNRHVQKHMKAGRTMKQAAASWKSGGRSKYSIRSKVKRVVRGKRPARLGNPNRGGRKVAKGFNTQKMFKLIRLAALAMPAAGVAMGPGSAQEKILSALQLYTGARPGAPFRADKLAEGWMPFLAATAVTYGIPKLTGILRGL